MSSFAIVKGQGVSDVDSVSAFDNALLNAGIGNYNLVPVSSIIPGGSIKIVNIPPLPPGTILHCILGRYDITANEIGVVSLGYSMSMEYGVVAEAIGTDVVETRNRCTQMLKEMTIQRLGIFEDPVIEIQNISCERSKYACGIIALLLLE